MTRIERDGLGTKELPENALYGIHTLRASENFPITGKSPDACFISNIVRIKKAAAVVNQDSGHLEERIAEAIIHACDELLAGNHTEAFIVDPMQGGAGTSYNMNANEVIANLAIKNLGGTYGQYELVHPIDHVNMHQSTNDVIPSAGKLTAADKTDRLLEELDLLIRALYTKAEEFSGILKVGRTQLQDAVPMRLNQTFHAYAEMLKRNYDRIQEAQKSLYRVSLGGTAIGTGICASAYYVKHIVPKCAELCGRPLVQAEDLFDAIQNEDDFVHLSAAVKVCALQCSKMASDLRLLSSGPRAGLGEIHLPKRQSGSSIMPGKINPVMPEALNQAAFLVLGHDMTISAAAEAGQLELNAFLPVILDQLFEEIDILSHAVHVFTEYCIRGIEADAEKCLTEAEECTSIAAALNPVIGYDRSTEIVHRAIAQNTTLYEAAKEVSGLSEKELQELLDPMPLTKLPQ